MSVVLLEVHSISRTEEEGLYLVEATASLAGGAPEVIDNYVRESDPHGLSPLVIAWMAENPEFPIQPYVPPNPLTPEELRTRMPRLTPRQLRLGLLAAGIAPSSVTTQLETIPDANQREAAVIEWEYATYYTRLHPLIATLGGVFGLTPEQIDTMWTASSTL